jgi:hypothetical protein
MKQTKEVVVMGLVLNQEVSREAVMVGVLELLRLPFRALWFLVKLLVAPVVIVAAAYLVLGAESLWFAGVVVVCVLFSALFVWLWALQVRGVLRSLARGTSTVRLASHRGRALRVRAGNRRWGGGR